MRPPNDLQLCEQTTRLRLLARRLNEPGSEMALFEILSDMEIAAHKAQLRLNDLLYGRGFKPPEEQMGT